MKGFAGLLVLLGLAPTPARADDPARAAQVAFEEGRRLADAGDFAGAARRFEESERLDPALGTVLNLANSYEHARRLASAWRAFHRGADDATALGEAKRARRALERAEALAPRLSTLVVRVHAPAEGEEVLVDDALVPAATWDAGLAVDGGVHRLRVRAPGRSEWTAEVTVAAEGEHADVAVPELAPAPVEAPPPPISAESKVAPLVPPGPTPPPATNRLETALRIGGWASVGLGAVAAGVGVGFGLEARARWSDRQAQCAYDHCNAAGYAMTDQARQAATRATVSFIVAGTALASGVSVLLLAPRWHAKTVEVSVTAAPGGAGLRIGGTF